MKLPDMPVVKAGTRFSVAAGWALCMVCKQNYAAHRLVAVGNTVRPDLILHQLCDGSYVEIGHRGY